MVHPPPFGAVPVEEVFQRLKVFAPHRLCRNLAGQLVRLDQPLHGGGFVRLDLDVKLVVVPLRQGEGWLRQHSHSVDPLDGPDLGGVKRAHGTHDDGRVDFLALHLLPVLLDLGTGVLVGHVELVVFGDHRVELVERLEQRRLARLVLADEAGDLADLERGRTADRLEVGDLDTRQLHGHPQQSNPLRNNKSPSVICPVGRSNVGRSADGVRCTAATRSPSAAHSPRTGRCPVGRSRSLDPRRPAPLGPPGGRERPVGRRRWSCPPRSSCR